MRFYRYKREKTLGTHNFGGYQFFVCELSDTKGVIHKGITVQPSDSIIEIPYPMHEQQAKDLIVYLTSITESNIPSTHKLKKGWANYFSNLHFKITKLKEGNIKGRIAIYNLFSARSAWVTIKPSSVKACTAALQELYDFA